MGVVAVKSEQVNEMLHAIGYEPKRVKRGKYIAFRNRYITGCPDVGWNKLVEKGFATMHNFGANEVDKDSKMYCVTRAGMDFLEGVTGAKIVEDD